MDNAAGDAAPCTYIQNFIVMILCTSCAFFRLRCAFFVEKAFQAEFLWSSYETFI